MAKMTRNILISFAAVLFVFGMVASGTLRQTSRDVLRFSQGRNDTIQGMALQLQPAEPDFFPYVVSGFVFGISVMATVVVIVTYKGKSATRNKRRSPRPVSGNLVSPQPQLREGMAQHATHTISAPQITEGHPRVPGDHVDIVRNANDQ